MEDIVENHEIGGSRFILDGNEYDAAGGTRLLSDEHKAGYLDDIPITAFGEIACREDVERSEEHTSELQSPA